MKIKALKNEVVVTLELTESEAKRLQGFVQNPLCHPDDESHEDSEFRRMLFDGIKRSLSGSSDTSR